MPQGPNQPPSALWQMFRLKNPAGTQLWPLGHSLSIAHHCGLPLAHGAAWHTAPTPEVGVQQIWPPLQSDPLLHSTGIEASSQSADVATHIEAPPKQHTWLVGQPQGPPPSKIMGPPPLDPDDPDEPDDPDPEPDEPPAPDEPDEPPLDPFPPPPLELAVAPSGMPASLLPPPHATQSVVAIMPNGTTSRNLACTVSPRDSPPAGGTSPGRHSKINKPYCLSAPLHVPMDMPTEILLRGARSESENLLKKVVRQARRQL